MPMAEPLIGLVTVGQTPRDDLRREFCGGINGRDILITGALDGRSSQEINSLQPLTSKDYPIRCSLRSGAEATVSKARLRPLVQQCVSELEEQGARLIVIGCSSDFTPLDSRVPVLSVGSTVNRLVHDLAGNGKLGCLVPLADQVTVVQEELTTAGISGIVMAAGPYDEESYVLEQALAIERAGCTLLYLRCFGFGSSWQQRVAKHVEIPVVSPVKLAATIASSLLENHDFGTGSTS